MKKKWKMLPALLLLFVLGYHMQPVQAEVTSSQLILETDKETGEEIYARKYVVDGKTAVCIEGTVRVPKVGDSTSEWIEMDNDSLRKVLYYGNMGPDDRGYTFVETVCAAQEANGDGNSDLGIKILAEIVLLPSPPDYFRVWKVETRDGTRQDLAFYTTGVEGELSLKKVSAREDITEGDDTYSLEGAVYEIYSDPECTEKEGELVTDENGQSESITLEDGTYYLKEVKAPPGYRLNQTVVEAKVLVERTVEIQVEDEPDIEIGHVLPETGSSSLFMLEIISIEMMLLSTKKRRNK